ncbi:MAG: ferredoxin family protein [Methanobrevibacter sp.]|nr:ferredoxin family protein [Methanobrevibacter sp.]
MIIVNPDLCKGCDICIESCPRQVYAKSEELNKKGVCLPYLDNEEKCRKCHLCELLCPDQAIIVEEEDD